MSAAAAEYFLAIDQSTSATKAVLFDSAGTVIDKASREHRQIYPQPGGLVEHDAEEIWQNLLAVVDEIADRNRDKLHAAAGLAITNQRETFVVFERATGKPLTNAVVWQCRRGEEVCRQLAAAGKEEIIRRKTGLLLDTYFSGPKLKQLLHDRPEIKQQLAAGDALVGTIDTYLVYRLTGGQVFATDSTNASRTLLYNIDRLAWDEELCTLFDVPMRALAEVRECFANFGETDAEQRLPKKLPICGVMGDSQASLFAQRCFEAGTGKATFGSGTSIMLNVGSTRPNDQQGIVTAIAWVQAGRPVYAYEGLIVYSSATISWLQNQLGLITDAADTEQLAIEAGDHGGVYFVPAFAGLAAPYWKPEARAAIVGLSPHVGKQHIVRAALESVGYQINDVLTMMRRETDVVPQMLYADGGPTRNNFLMQFTADVAQVKLTISDVPNSSALGAALAGMLGLGLHKSLADLAALPLNEHHLSPSIDAAAAAELVRGWTRAVERVM